VAAHRSDRFRSNRPSALAGGLLDRTRLTELTDDSRVRRRTGSQLAVRVEGDRLLAFLGDRMIRMPAWLAPAIELLGDGEPHRVGEVAGVDAAGRLVLVRRLVREGLLEVLV
jgi:hypothetical protein